MKTHTLHPQLLRCTAGLLLAGWGLIALHALEHHAHGEVMDHAGCEACEFFLSPADLVEAALVAVVLAVVAGHTLCPPRRGIRVGVRCIGRAPPAPVLVHG
jgi:hypothetical protein